MSISDKDLGFLQVSREYGIYFQESASASNLNECIVFDIKLGDKICSFVVLYRSPSQSSDEFIIFFKKFRTKSRSCNEKYSIYDGSSR